MARRALTINVNIEGVRETLAAFRRLPREADRELRDRSMELARALADRAKTAAHSDPSPQAALFAGTIRPRRDRVPVIVAGGSKRVGRRRAPVWRILFGGEFGSNQYPQFGKRHQGRQGGPFFGTVEREQATISRAWNEAADAIVDSFTRGGGV